MSDPVIPIQAVERYPDGAIEPSGKLLSPSNLPIDYVERFRALALNPEFSETVFAHIANGGTLITLAETWGVRHSDISGYISTKPELRARYDFALIARGEWEVERCLQELRAIATVDIRQAYNEDGTLKSVREMPPEVAAALSSVESDELFEGHGDEREMIGYTKKVKFWDKAKAIELFMKKHGLLIERKEVKITRTLEDILSASHEIVDADVVVTPKIVTENPNGGGVPGVLGSKNHSA